MCGARALGLVTCSQGDDHDYLAHLNAPNIAYDLDLVRNLSGFQTLDFYGGNYGSTVGITYAALFPERVRRMILEGTKRVSISSNITVCGTFRYKQGSQEMRSTLVMKCLPTYLEFLQIFQQLASRRRTLIPRVVRLQLLR